MDDVVAPPYDVISPAERDALHDKSEYNSTRLILNKESHAEAAKLFRGWQEQGVLSQDDGPCFYLYAQDFEANGTKRRTGVIGALHLEPFSTGVVRPHERTFPKHKADRLVLTQETRANMSPIFGLYSNADFSPEPEGGWDSPAELDVEHAGVRSRLWVVRDPEKLEAFAAALEGRTVFIADGHHRYETALNYFGVAKPDEKLDETGPGPSDDEEPAAHVMAFLAAFEDPGMVILPTHRRVEDSGGVDWAKYAESLGGRFSVRKFPFDAAGRKAAVDAIEGAAANINAFALAVKGASEILFFEKEAQGTKNGGPVLADLDVTVLHSELIEELMPAAGGSAEPKLSYSADTDAVFDDVASGDLEAVFVMRATRSDQLADVCMAGDLMPQKSTYFYPKLLTGLVFHKLEA